MNTLLIGILCSLPLLGGDDTLDKLLVKHFRAKSTEQRERIQRDILNVKGLTPKKLVKGIRSAKLWKDFPAGEQRIDLRLRKGKSSTKEVWVSLPDGYSTKKKWPLIITLHGQNGQAKDILDYTLRLLGERSNEFIVAAPQDLGPVGFSQPTHTVAQPRHLLYALRRTFRMDNDHVYLMGYSLGGRTTWLGALMHADCFAGAMSLTTALQIVGDDLIYDVVLPNLKYIPILFCWGENDNLDSDGNLSLSGGNVAQNRTLTKAFKAIPLKRFKAIEIKDMGHDNVVPPQKPFSKLLNSKRQHFPKRVRQVFRLPDQSDAYWVAADRLIGSPLSSGVIQVAYEPGEDPREATRKHLISKLGLIDARCKGQTISLTTRRCGNVILLLNDALIDLNKDVTIRRNDRTRFQGKIERDLKVMLTEAARTWDFDRLYTARVVIPVGGKAKLGYPSKNKDRDKKGRIKASKN